MTIMTNSLIARHNATRSFDDLPEITRLTEQELACYQGIENPDAAWIAEIEVEGIEGQIVLDGPELQIHLPTPDGADIISWAYENCVEVQAEAMLCTALILDHTTGLGFRDLEKLGFQHIAGEL